jgi:MutS-like protein
VTSPLAEYARRLDLRRLEDHRLSRTDARLSYFRLAVFGVSVALLVLSLRGQASPWLLIAPALLFGVLLHLHDQVFRARTAAQRAIAYYERGLARIEDRWAGTGEPGEQFRDDGHLYANDLDLFGRASLFELLSVAATPAGEETLAGWLKAPAAAPEIVARQTAVTELTDALDLRESLGRAAIDVRKDVHTAPLLTWAERPRQLSPVWLASIARLFTVTVVAAIAYMAATSDSKPLLAVLTAQSLFTWPQLRRLEHVLHGAEAVTRDLDTLSRLLSRIEAESFAAPRLRDLQQRLRSGGSAFDGSSLRRDPPYTTPDSASHAIRRLHRLTELYEWQHNNVFLVVSMPFLMGTHLAWAIESWRARHGAYIRRWLAAVGEFEALASLSAYRFEHPDDPFPEIVATGDRQAHFEGLALGHPLLAAARIVRNNVTLSDTTRLMVVSGSNMSGKSTLLRTVGTNAVLAFAGAPVRAQSLRLSPLAIGATLRIQDSLQEGRSRFYAEITRIRELADIARAPLDGAQGTPPLLFLLDELFHGTNSHDRLVGASGVLRSLLDRGAIGMITTHDLALTAIADNLGAHAANVHFEEWFDAGEMRFDYRLKPGRVTRSNALALMRAVGLEVETDG